jgi:hypothetical protein
MDKGKAKQVSNHGVTGTCPLPRASYRVRSVRSNLSQTNDVCRTNILGMLYSIGLTYWSCCAYDATAVCTMYSVCLPTMRVWYTIGEQDALARIPTIYMCIVKKIDIMSVTERR